MSFQAKKLINSSETCVEDMLNGIKSVFPGLSVHVPARIVMRCQTETSDNCVGIISGGGSGHEPFCSGFVGRGMLNAAVSGSVFTAPPALNCLTAIQNVAERNQGGVIVLIPNYTGDILNFGEAIEMARDQGYKVESVVVGEDCALLQEDSNEVRAVGRRGLCGQIFMYKIAGSLACSGHNISTIVEVCHKMLSNMGSLGVCTSPCTLPGANNPLFYLAPHHMELGLGVHGEAGVTKINMCSANEVVKIILKKIVLTLSLNPGDDVCAIINNLGGSSQMESYVIAGEVSKQLGNHGIKIHRMYVGTLLTSLDMGGVQICLLKITNNKEWIELLDSETDAFAWPGRVTSFEQNQVEIIEKINYNRELIGPELTPEESKLFKNCLNSVAVNLQSAEERLNNLDSGCGDGDCGTTLRHLADGIIESLHNLPVHRPTSCFLELAEIASETMGGTSGGIYSLLLRGAARMVPDWPSAFQEAVETVKKYSPAREGSRTMMDALIPACNEFTRLDNDNWQVALTLALERAEEGCERTRTMDAKCGRASYVNKSYLTDIDAGAYAITIILRAIYNELCSANH